MNRWSTEASSGRSASILASASPVSSYTRPGSFATTESCPANPFHVTFGGLEIYGHLPLFEEIQITGRVVLSDQDMTFREQALGKIGNEVCPTLIVGEHLRETLEHR